MTPTLPGGTTAPAGERAALLAGTLTAMRAIDPGYDPADACRNPYCGHTIDRHDDLGCMLCGHCDTGTPTPADCGCPTATCPGEVCTPRCRGVACTTLRARESEAAP